MQDLRSLKNDEFIRKSCLEALCKTRFKNLRKRKASSINLSLRQQRQDKKWKLALMPCKANAVNSSTEFQIYTSKETNCIGNSAIFKSKNSNKKLNFTPYKLNFSSLRGDKLNWSNLSPLKPFNSIKQRPA